MEGLIEEYGISMVFLFAGAGVFAALESVLLMVGQCL